ncbi:arsinothricin resistance N-acetyltransferase ArsN1 family B [Rubinisphaera sp.]|uniref:arsinothricin resistance N-acetyltransferase ArsN1 family B n=1 Tax=Rubinisphaera sp. TaxID=2024857 RepID=UPI000C0F503E|nr:arsinothricin resistance N-acetyltransferase ArsN1 family B [Rubinisphaera sp.]MBV09384.1 phosphinothricin acetyltransferase [Rubinisphaera sp.]HCS55647.1 phosphinothricin acetyltransferase [Planctomycetaceae bacterium]|tara:strand:+ start:166 stop:681 length:516 start_codon:yes stop_codon:yes gene_type:complete
MTAKSNSSEPYVRLATSADAAAIVEIYNYYITDTIITFEEEIISAAEMARRMNDIAALNLPWLVAEVEGQVAGYAYAGSFRTRSAFRFTAEVTVYLDLKYAGQGLGTKLYADLFAKLKESGIHVVIGGISLPNESSVALHEKFGMEKVAHFKEVGYKFNQWIDVGFWQRML